MVTPQKFTKMIRNILYNFQILASDPKKFFGLMLITGNVLENLEQLVESPSPRGPTWNVWESGYYFAQQEFLPYLQERQFVAFYISATICIECLHLLNNISSVWPQTHRPISQAWRVLYLQCTRTGGIFTLPYLIVFSRVL